MKAYALDLRERVVKFIQGWGSKAEAARRKLDPEKLRAHVKKHPDATLKEIQGVFGVSHHAVWVRLGQLGFTLKKTHKISRTQRGAAVAVRARTGKAQRPDRLLPRRVRRGPPPAS